MSLLGTAELIREQSRQREPRRLAGRVNSVAPASPAFLVAWHRVACIRRARSIAHCDCLV